MKPLLALFLILLVLSFQPSTVTIAQDVDDDCPPQAVLNWLVERQKWQNATNDVRMAADIELSRRLVLLHQNLEAVEDLERPACLDGLMLATYAEYNALSHLLVCESQAEQPCIDNAQARLNTAQSQFNSAGQPYLELAAFNPDEYAAARPEGWQLPGAVPSGQQAEFRDDGRIYLGDTVIFDEEVVGCNPGGDISYAPTGEHFLVILYCVEGDNELFLFSADGSDQRRITGPGNRLNYTNYAWDEDGRSFVYLRTYSFGASAPPDALPQGMARYDIETGQTSMVLPFRVVDVASNDVLNIRSGPGADNPVVGEIPSDGTGIRVTGDGVVVGDSRWVPIVYGSTEGWVNSQYLTEEVSPEA